jgi:hypothetical protein
MVLDAAGTPLREADLPAPEPGPGELLLEVAACGVCRTDLHIVDGELTEPKLPLVPGHQIVARVSGGGERFAAGDRVGVPWLGWTDGTCRFCRSGRENLCDQARFTGYQRDGGYAQTAVADERFCFPIPAGYPDLQAAPLLCAGLIGFRTLKLAGDGERLGIYGFGGAAHIVCQVAVHQGRRVFAFTRAGDESTQRFALELGAEWAGDALGPALGRADAALGSEPHPRRRGGVPGLGAGRAGPDGGRDLPTPRGKRGARPPAFGTDPGRRRARSLSGWAQAARRRPAAFVRFAGLRRASARRKRSSASAIALQAEALMDMPMCDPSTSTCSAPGARHARQSTIPSVRE